MAMGKTGTVNITPEMLKNALNVIEEYQTKTNDLHSKLNDTMSALVPGSFSGNAADGFKFFFDDKIEPAIGEGLTKMIKAVNDIVEGTLEAIPDNNGLDDQLADENKK